MDINILMIGHALHEQLQDGQLAGTVSINAYNACDRMTVQVLTHCLICWPISVLHFVLDQHILMSFKSFAVHMSIGLLLQSKLQSGGAPSGLCMIRQ